MSQSNLSREEIAEIVQQTVKETLTSMGIDTHDPIAMQRDFQSLRDWRRASEAIQSKGVLTLVGIVAAGILGVIWLGLKHAIRP